MPKCLFLVALDLFVIIEVNSYSHHAPKCQSLFTEDQSFCGHKTSERAIQVTYVSPIAN